MIKRTDGAKMTYDDLVNRLKLAEEALTAIQERSPGNSAEILVKNYFRTQIPLIYTPKETLSWPLECR